MLYTLDVTPGDEELLNAWYTHEHVPERVSTPGFLRGRRYLRAPGSAGPRHLTIYETIDVTVFSSAEYLRRLNDPTPLTQDVVGRFIDPQRAVLRVLFSHGATIGRELTLARVSPEHSTDLASWIAEHAENVLSHPAVCGLHVAETDLAVTHVKRETAEGQGAAEAAPRAERVILFDALGDVGDVIARATGDLRAEITTYEFLALLDHAAAGLRPGTSPGTTP